MSGRVVVVGSLNVDLVTRVQRHPRPGETVTGTGLLRLPGGKGANQALAAARAGARTALVGRVGDDAAGSAYLGGLSARGVDVGGVRRTADVPTGHALIAVDPAGENTIVVVPGANGALAPADLGPLHADVVLLQLEVPLATVVAAATTASGMVVLNPSPWAPLPAGLLEAVDVLVVNEHEAAALGPVAGAVVTTHGARGAVWEAGGTRVEVAPPEVDAIDTTGAGDAFTGALAAALAAGAEPAEALERAVHAGAAATTYPGAQDWALPG